MGKAKSRLYDERRFALHGIALHSGETERERRLVEKENLIIATARHCTQCGTVADLCHAPIHK